jgi:hypothetical protein
VDTQTKHFCPHSDGNPLPIVIDTTTRWHNRGGWWWWWLPCVPSSKRGQFTQASTFGGFTCLDLSFI